MVMRSKSADAAWAGSRQAWTRTDCGDRLRTTPNELPRLTALKDSQVSMMEPLEGDFQCLRRPSARDVRHGCCARCGGDAFLRGTQCIHCQGSGPVIGGAEGLASWACSRTRSVVHTGGKLQAESSRWRRAPRLWRRRPWEFSPHLIGRVAP